MFQFFRVIEPKPGRERYLAQLSPCAPHSPSPNFLAAVHCFGGWNIALSRAWHPSNRKGLGAREGTLADPVLAAVASLALHFAYARTLSLQSVFRRYITHNDIL